MRATCFGESAPKIRTSSTRALRSPPTRSAADRDLGRLDEAAGQILADPAATVVAQPGQSADSDALEGLGGRELVEHGARQLAVQAADIACELREAQIDETVQLAHPVAEVLHEAVPMMHELSQFVGGLVRQPSRRGLLLGGEAGNALCVDGVGLGPLEILLGEAVSPQRVDQGHWDNARPGPRKRSSSSAPSPPSRLPGRVGQGREQGLDLPLQPPERRRPRPAAGPPRPSSAAAGPPPSRPGRRSSTPPPSGRGRRPGGQRRRPPRPPSGGARSASASPP